MGAFGSVAYGQGVDYYTSGMTQSYTSYYTGASVSGEPPGRWSGAGAAKLGLSGEVKPEAMKDLYEKGLDPRDPSGRTRFGTVPRNYKSAHEVIKERLVQAGDISDERVQELWTEARTMAGTPRQAEELLESMLGDEAGMLAEQVRAVQLDVKRTVRTDNRFADFTWSPSKDVTVQHTAAEWAERQAVLAGRTEEAALYRYVRETIEQACEKGNAAALAYLNKHAGYARTGRHGKGCTGTWTEAKDWTVATFPQHTSRANDPQLHWHNPILLDTECPVDGKVRKIHTTLIQAHKHGAAAVGSRVMQEEITAKLGWEFALREDENCFELTNVDQRVKDLFSDRAKNIDGRTREYVKAFVDRFGHEPNALQLNRLKQRATLETRDPKPKTPETREQHVERWDAEMRAEVGAGMARQAALAGRSAPPPLPAKFSPSAVIAETIAALQDAGATWTRSEFTAMLEKRLPAYLGLAEPEQVIDLLDSLTDVGLASDQVVQITNHTPTRTTPAALTLDSGESAYVQPGSTRYASCDHVAAEYAFQAAAVLRGRRYADRVAVDRWIDTHAHMGLGKDQAAALRGIARSGAALSVLIGPAGAGKTYVLGGLAAAWSDLTGGRVIGLATSEQATDVLRGENVTAKNIAQWLGAQQRIAENRASADDRQWAVQPGDIIVPDEASMADTDKLALIRDYVERAEARMLLTGDHRQLSAVGAGGAMELVVNTDRADVYELTEVRRFTNAWEGPASLELRAGNVEVLDTYDAHGRIVDGGTVETAAHTAARMYLGDRLGGKSSVVVTPTNAMAAQVNALVRDGLVEVGRVDARGVHLSRDGNAVGVGDLVKCRQNDWSAGVKNQGRYLVVGIEDDGGLRLREEAGDREVTVSAAYRDEWVELGYAGTVHSVQGGTFDTGIPIVDASMPCEALYPAMTRGRERNTAVVITRREVDGQETGQTHEREPRDAAAVLADIIERDNEAGRAALTMQREHLERARNMRTIADMRENAVRYVVRERTSQWLDRMVVDGALSESDRQTLASDRATEQLGRLLRSVEQAGHDPERALRQAVTSRSLDDANSLAQVLYARISREHRGQLAPDLDRVDEMPAAAPDDFREHLDELADLARERRIELGEQIAQEPPAWAVKTLGDVPDDVVERADWVHRAGIIAAYREAAEWDDQAEALNPPPGLSKTEARVAWHEAWQAAGRPDATAEETTMSEGALRVRVRAAEHQKAWMPPPVHDQLRATELELVTHQQEQAILAARAEATHDEAERARLLEQAADKQAMAERLNAKRAELQAVADARLAAIAEQEMTRDLGQRSLAELAHRGVDLNNEPDQTTAVDWLAEHRAAMVAEDPHREITEVDAPSEVYDAELDDLVAVADEVLDAEAIDAPAIEASPSAATADVVDAEVVEDQVAEAARSDVKANIAEQKVEAKAESDLPKGVPTDVEIRAAAAKARAAEAEIADRESAEQAARAAEEAASREAYYEAERQERLEAERAAEQDYADTW